VSGGAVAEAGAVSRVAQRAARGRKRWRVEGARASRIPSDAKRSEDQRSGAKRRAKGQGKAAARGASSGAAAPRLRGAKGGRAMGA